MSRLRLKRLKIILLVCLLAVLCIKAAHLLTDRHSAKETDGKVSVMRVVDGDTIVVLLNESGEKLRLIGMNTPETVDPRRPVQCYGPEASARAKQLLDGKRVRLEADPSTGERDKYHRLLRYVILPDGTNYNLLMIREGYARENGYGRKYKYRDEFRAAQQEARAASRGLWSACGR